MAGSVVPPHENVIMGYGVGGVVVRLMLFIDPYDRLGWFALPKQRGVMSGNCVLLLLTNEGFV